jgi:hypothetical protein
MWIFIAFSLLFTQTVTKKPVNGSDAGSATAKTPIVKITSDEVLVKAKAESLQGNHNRVIELLRPLLYPTSVFSTERKEIIALRLLGLSFWFKGDTVNSQTTFTVLLTKRPNFILDPVVVPLGAIEFFSKMKKKLKERLEEIKKIKKLEDVKHKKERELARKKRIEDLKKNAPILVKNRVIIPSYRAYSLFPMGIGQFQNGEKSKGWVIMGAQILTGMISISAYSYLIYKYPSGYVPKDEISSAEQLQYLQVGSGVAFFAIWLVGVVDALYNFKTSTFEETEQFIPRKQYGFKVFGLPVQGGGILGISGEF